MTKQLGRPWAALMICSVLALGMTGPAWWADAPSLIGHWDALDLPGSVWAHWWVHHALQEGSSPFVDTVSFWPIGLDPVLQYNLLDALLGTPWIALLGVVDGYNVATLAALISTGMGGYVLGRAVGLTGPSAVFVAVAIQSSSAVALELYEGRLSQFLLVFLLLALAALARLLHQDGSWRLAVGLGVSAAATALVYWYAGLYFLLAGAALVAFSRARWTRPRMTHLAIAAVTGAVTVMPFVMDLVGQWSTLPGMGRNLEGIQAATNWVSTKSGVEIATENSRWWLWPILSRANQEAGHQLSLVVLALTVVALRARRPALMGWLAVAGIGWVLALGPFIHGYSTTTTVSAPFGWLQSLSPLFARMWWPQRFEILTAIGLAVAAGMGLDRVLKNRKRGGLGWALVLVLVVADAPLRSGVLPVRASEVPEYAAPLYRGLAGPLLTTPLQPSVRVLNHQRWIQTQHGQPILNGNGEHIPGHAPAQWEAWVGQSRLLAALLTLQESGELEVTIEPNDVDMLIDAGFRYAVADPTVYGDSSGRNWAATHGSVFSALWGSPLQRHRGGAVWAIEPIAAPVPLSARYLQRGDRVRGR